MKANERTYPRYMYHPEKADPLRVDSAAQEKEMYSKGWVAHYIHKEYPKWINGVIYQTEEEAREAGALKPEVLDLDKPKRGRPKK